MCLSQQREELKCIPCSGGEGQHKIGALQGAPERGVECLEQQFGNMRGRVFAKIGQDGNGVGGFARAEQRESNIKPSL